MSDLSGLAFCISGSLSETRKAVETKIKANGGKVTSKVTKTTTHLITSQVDFDVGSNAKVQDAVAKSLHVCSEDYLNELIASGSSAAAHVFSAGADDTTLNVAKGKAKAKGTKRKKASAEKAPKAAAAKKAKPAPKPKAKKPAAAVKAEPAAAAASPMKTAADNGGGEPRAPAVDRSLPGGESYMIYQDYHTKLMQSNVGDNNNKFYIIQVVQKGSTYSCWTRWGRLGENGQSALAVGANAEDAIKKFSKKFRDKTKNAWQDRHAFVKHDKKYQLVETTGEDDGGSDDAALGRLSEDQVKKGLQVLDEIKGLVAEGAHGGAFTGPTSAFYSLIPTTSGRVAPPLLNNDAIVGEKEALLEFWLRMGFEDMKVDNLSPIDGILDLPLPTTLKQAAAKISNDYAITAALTSGAEMAGRSAGGPIKPMGKELYGSILLYTGNSIYSQLNAALRSGNRRNVEKYFTYLRLFFEAMSCMEQKKRTLWRGISVDLFREYEVGKVITWWSVSSCTSDESVARNFMNGCGGACTLLTIECKTAMDVSALSFYSHEKESLLAPGTQLEILKRTRKGKVTEIHAREVGQAIS